MYVYVGFMYLLIVLQSKLVKETVKMAEAMKLSRAKSNIVSMQFNHCWSPTSYMYMYIHDCIIYIYYIYTFQCVEQAKELNKRGAVGRSLNIHHVAAA